MKKSINEKYVQPFLNRNDIYRKFEKQFKDCFLNPINIDEELYVEESKTIYKEIFDMFLGGANSDIKFFIGYTGVGKTTFIKHYFGLTTLGVLRYKSDAYVVPNRWDGRRITSKNSSETIDMQISNVIDNLISKLYKPYEELLLNESDEIVEFISNNRPDVLYTLDYSELMYAQKNQYGINQVKLQKSKNINPVEFSCSVLKYVMEKHNDQDIKRLIFVVDDLETLSQENLCYIIDRYLNIYDCLHNVSEKIIIKLLISLRPHSFRFLKNTVKYRYISCYGNQLQNESYRLIKDETPNIKKIFKKRFEYAAKRGPKPGNQSTWDIAKNTLYEIIDEFDTAYIKMISDLCHMNIRAITDCFQMILSNRVWCQEIKETTEFPTVIKSDYHFDVVNIVRTLACGENSVYTGLKDVQFNPGNLLSMQSRPSFDDSKVFIPNLLINIDNNECDIFPALIVRYLESYFSSGINTLPQTEFITKKILIDNLYEIFNSEISYEQISNIINYLFENRIVRKSIINKDDDSTINQLSEDDYLYLTLKGSRLLSMFESDSILLEIYREDIKREYTDETYYKTSFELIAENKRVVLFDDLIKLLEIIFYNEDKYQRLVYARRSNYLFYSEPFSITRKLLLGVQNSLSRAQNIPYLDKDVLCKKIIVLEEKIRKRIDELNFIVDKC